MSFRVWRFSAGAPESFISSTQAQTYVIAERSTLARNDIGVLDSQFVGCWVIKAEIQAAARSQVQAGGN